MRWHGEQTGRWTYRLIPELATWLNRKYGEIGFYLAQALSGHGCFNAYLKRLKERDEEMCYYCNSPVDNAEHALFVCAKWGVAGRSSFRQWVPSSLLTRWSLWCSSLSGFARSSSHSSHLWWGQESSMGVGSETTGRASGNRIGTCARGPASWADFAVRFA